jgi:hypothetical protein
VLISPVQDESDAIYTWSIVYSKEGRSVCELKQLGRPSAYSLNFDCKVRLARYRNDRRDGYRKTAGTTVARHRKVQEGDS